MAGPAGFTLAHLPHLGSVLPAACRCVMSSSKCAGSSPSWSIDTGTSSHLHESQTVTGPDIHTSKSPSPTSRHTLAKKHSAELLLACGCHPM